MVDRGFSEVDLRTMLEDARSIERDVVDGRFAILSNYDGEPWKIILEPDDRLHHLVVVTAYPVEESLDEA